MPGILGNSRSGYRDLAYKLGRDYTYGPGMQHVDPRTKRPIGELQIGPAAIEPSRPGDIMQLAGTAMGQASRTYGAPMAQQMYADPGLASITSPSTYMQMRAADQRIGASTSLLNRNAAALSGLGQPNPAGAMADGVLGGQRLTGGPPSDSGWMTGGRTYGGVGRLEPMPDPNQMQVQPQYGQTAAEAQQAYLGQQAEAARQMGQRVGSMTERGLLSNRGPAVGYTAPSTGNELLVAPQVMGSTGNVGLRVSGNAPSRERWDGMISSLPGAEGRTNGEMAALARENRRSAQQDRRDNRAISRAILSGRRNMSSIPALAAAASRQGVLLPGQRANSGTSGPAPGVTSGVTRPTTQEEAANGLLIAQRRPFYQVLGGFDPAAATPREWEQFLSNPDIDRLSPEERQQISQDMAYAEGLVNWKPTASQRRMFDAFRANGAKGVADTRRVVGNEEYNQRRIQKGNAWSGLGVIPR